MADKALCSIPDCDKQSIKRGWCNRHYKRWLRHGNPQSGSVLKGAPLKWLEQFLATTATDDCVSWPFGRAAAGYGVVYDNDGKHWGVHRLVCVRMHGEPENQRFHAAHACGNHECINPRHLRWATRAENEADKISPGRSNRGDQRGCAKVTVAQVKIIRASIWTKDQEKSLAMEFGVTPSTIRQISKGKSWKWLT